MAPKCLPDVSAFYFNYLKRQQHKENLCGVWMSAGSVACNERWGVRTERIMATSPLIPSFILSILCPHLSSRHMLITSPSHTNVWPVNTRLHCQENLTRRRYFLENSTCAFFPPFRLAASLGVHGGRIIIPMAAENHFVICTLPLPSSRQIVLWCGHILLVLISSSG